MRILRVSERAGTASSRDCGAGGPVLVAAVLVALVALGVLGCVPGHAGPLPREARQEAPKEAPNEAPLHEALMLSLTINAQPGDQAVLVLRDRAGQWLLPVDALRAAGVLLSDIDPVRVGGNDYVPLAALGTPDTAFDASRLQLDVRLAAERFVASRLSSRPLRPNVPATPAVPAAGAYLNYDLLVDHTPAGRGLSMFAEGAASIGSGVAVSHHLFSDRPGVRDSIRLETTYTVDKLSQVATLRLGDAVTRPANALARPVRFAGVQWGTNFQTRPGMITLPVATLSGQAALPSTIDLYVDNVLQAREPVRPGPFSITSMPLVSGDGEVVVRVTDLAGQQTLISQRFYSSTAMLAPGLSDYSVELGALRREFGWRSNAYGDPFLSAGWRHGWNQRLTVELGGSLQKSGAAGLLAGLAAAFPGIGIGTAGLGFSDGPDGSGAQFALGFERRTRSHTLSARSQHATDDFRQTGVDPGQVLRRLDSIFYGYRIAGIGHLGLSFTRQQRQAGAAVAIATASLGSRPTPWGSLVLSLTETRADRTDHQIGLYWVKGLGRDTSVSAFHSRAGEGRAQDAIQLQKNMTPGEGWGYRLQAAREAAQQASVFGQNGYGFGRLELAELNGQTSVRAGLSGGIATLDGQWFVSRRIDGSFGVASVPGLANVRVYVDNQLAGRTNDKGYALLPRLYPYMKNNVSIEQLDLPIDVQVGTLKMQPVPAWRSGLRIDFPIRHAAAATLDLVRADGSPVPAGAVATLSARDGTKNAGDDEPFVVGHRGLVYLSGLSADNRLHVRWPGGACMVIFAYEAAKGQVPYLGQFDCTATEATR
jgi:outer membrane usher protein